MKFYKQTILHDPDSGLYGDCFRTCIACFLDMLPSDVPHFFDNGIGGVEGEEKCRAWLEERGLYLFRVAYGCSLEDVVDHVSVQNPGLYFMVSGMSPRGAGHSVIAKDGEFVHDPHPNDDFLEGPFEDGIFWISVLAKK
jgi:hypothetical protein